MKKATLTLFRSFLVIPFTAGNRRNSSDRFRLYDCSTASTIMFLLLLASIVVFTGSLAIMNGAMQRVQVIKGVLIMIDLAGIVTCALIGYLIHKHGVPYTDLSRSITRSESKHLQVGFLWLFALLSTLFFCFKSAVEIECWNMFSSTQTIDSTLRIILIACQTTAIRYLTVYKVEHCPSLKHAIRVLLGINVCFWVNSFVRDKTIVNPSSQMGPDHNISYWIHCAFNSTSGLLYYSSKKFIIPAYVEFMLLCITLLNEISAMNSSKNESNTESVEYNINDNSPADEEEDTPLVPTSSRPSVPNICVYITVILSAFVSLPNIILHIIHDLFSNEDLEIPVIMYEISMKSVMIIATILAFYYTETIMEPPTVSVWQYSTRDRVFLASVLAIFSNHCFAVMATCLSDTETSKTVLTGDCLKLIQVYFQSVFLIHASRCVRKAGYENCNVFVCTCMFLAFTNLGCWIVDSFIIGQTLTRMKDIQIQILQPTIWHVLYEIFGPLTMYYSFASVFAFRTLYMKFSAR
ncbi:uncharacterized protein LOC117333395 [Pecten maximus]|uniref:uncharacterized protein LOC117333395 n=1 Tax=Pecten maximus TaxID=6579 RepID=UPI0014584A38|nr:uncharacterized protein LOC117333395 [Pecten maximus]